MAFDLTVEFGRHSFRSFHSLPESLAGEIMAELAGQLDKMGELPSKLKSVADHQNRPEIFVSNSWILYMQG